MHAHRKYALGAYNVNNMEQAIGLFLGNHLAKAPFIVQISRGARSYAGVKMLENVIRAASDMFPENVFAVHLDHGDEETCYECIGSGFYSSVMIDASHETFEENVNITKRVVKKAHESGVSVEAELGLLGGVEEHIEIDERHAMLTDPKEASEFVSMTGCDSLAVAIGTSHGAYKFTGGQGLHFDRIKAIQELLPEYPLVMHGSSSVPKSEVDRINNAGGNLDESARGVDDKEFSRAVSLGVSKVNIDTDGRLVWTRVHREYFRDHPEGYDFRKPGKILIDEYAKFIQDKSNKLMSSNMIGNLKEFLGK
tara:strand:- start:255 stop:1181 length:927 start_codon:yes stop_codon:yes gene_type:complete